MTVLVDTGCGADTAEEPGATAGFLMRNLAAIGIGPDDVDLVDHLPLPRRSRERPRRAGRRPGVPARRDHGARERVELLDGRRRARASDARPDAAALRAQPRGLRPARRPGAHARLGRGGGAGRDRDRDAGPLDRAHLVSRLLGGRERLPDPGRVESPRALARAPRLAPRLRPGSGRRPRRPAAARSTGSPASRCRCRASTFPFPGHATVEAVGDAYRAVPIA